MTTALYKKGDVFTIQGNDNQPLTLRIENDPQYIKGFNDPSYKVSFDGKKMKALLPEGLLTNYINMAERRF